MIWNFWKVTINFCESVNPLWLSSRFSRSKHYELWSRHHCIKSVTVQLLWQVMLHQRLQLKQKNKTKKCRQRNCPLFILFIFCDVIMSATSAWSSFSALRDVLLNGGTSQRAKETRHVSLAPNRGNLGVLWTYSGTVVVLSWDLTHNKNWRTSTQTHAWRVTLNTDPSLLDTNRRGSTRPRIKHTPLRIKTSDFKNRPVNLAKTAALLPRHFCINFKMFSLNQQGDPLSAPPCHTTD